MKDLRDNRRLSESSIPYTDDQLLEMLEAEGYKANYTNLLTLKEGIANGSIIIESNKNFPDWKPATLNANKRESESGTDDVAYTEYNKSSKYNDLYKDDIKNDESMLNDLFDGKDAKLFEAKELKNPTTINSVDYKGPVTSGTKLDAKAGTRTVNTDKNPGLKAPEVKVEKAKRTPIKEGYNQTIALINSFLNEDCHGNIDFTILTEEVKSEGIKQIAVSLLKIIEDKLSAIDTTSADRSKGDIKQLRELESIQDAINNLERMIEQNYGASAEYSKAVNVVIKSLLYINQYSNVFKDAYRNKKTLMIMKYQALILSIISSVSYLISTLVTISRDNIELNLSADNIMEFSPLRGLAEFNKSVETGEFKIITKDVEMLREYFLELPVSTMTSVLEAVEYGPMIIDGIKNIYNNLINGNAKLTNLIYRAAGIFVLLLSLRDVLYTLFKMKTKVADMIQNIGVLSNIRTLGNNILAKLGLFNVKFKDDAEVSSNVSKKEIEEENKRLLLDVKSIQADQAIKPEPVKAEIIDTVISNPTPRGEVISAPKPIPIKAKELTPKPAPAPKPVENNPFGFDF